MGRCTLFDYEKINLIRQWEYATPTLSADKVKSQLPNLCDIEKVPSPKISCSP